MYEWLFFILSELCLNECFLECSLFSCKNKIKYILYIRKKHIKWNNLIIILKYNKMSSDKIKVAVRLRPFNRRGKFYINSSMNFTQLQNLRLWCGALCSRCELKNSWITLIFFLCRTTMQKRSIKLDIIESL